jgi:HK97 family phage portal protein
VTIARRLRESRANIQNPAVPLTAGVLSELFDAGFKNDAGVTVNELTAWQMPAVWRAMNLIAGTSASLPLHSYRQNTRKRVTVQLLANPHPDLTPYEFWELSYLHRLGWGNFYAFKRKNPAGMIRELWPLYPGAVKVGRTKDMGTKVYVWTDSDGSQHDFTDEEILHIPGMGYDGVCGVSPIRIARQSIGMALAAEQYGARLFGSGSLMSGILQTEQRLDEQQAQAIKDRWKESTAGLTKSHEVAVLGSGASFQPVTMPNSDAQFIESRRFQVSEIARWFGIPPHMLFDTEKSTSWGTGIEQQGIGFVVYTLRPWLKRTEERVTRVLAPPSVFCEYSVEGLLRGDSQARAEFYRTMREIGVLNVDEIRALENLEPLPDGIGEGYLQPLNFGPLGEFPDAQTDPGNGGADQTVGDSGLDGTASGRGGSVVSWTRGRVRPADMDRPA